MLCFGLFCVVFAFPPPRSVSYVTGVLESISCWIMLGMELISARCFTLIQFVLFLCLIHLVFWLAFGCVSRYPWARFSMMIVSKTRCCVSAVMIRGDEYMYRVIVQLVSHVRQVIVVVPKP